MGEVIRPHVPQWDAVIRGALRRVADARRDKVRAIAVQEISCSVSECPYQVLVYQPDGLVIDMAKTFIYFLSYQLRTDAFTAAQVLAKYFGVPVEDWTSGAESQEVAS